MSDEVNKHAEIIRNTVWHTYPYSKLGFSHSQPHADDCPGCLINVEVEKLVAELNALTPIENIVAELEHERNARKMLSVERDDAFKRAGVVEEGSVVDLVDALVQERDRLTKLLTLIRGDITLIERRFRE